jgi:RNA-directed DNA polymerase
MKAHDGNRMQLIFTTHEDTIMDQKIFRRPHDKSVAKFRARMKELTRRSWGVDNAYKVMKLNQLIRGWINYFKIGSMKELCARLDKNIRFRVRMCIWKHWKTPKNRAMNLIKLGVSKKYAWSTAYCGAHIAHVCQGGAMNIAVTKMKLGRFGLISMLDYYEEKRVTC